MKNIIFTTLAMVCLLTTQAQEFIVKYESQPGERPAFLSNIIGQSDQVSQDYNADGTPDLSTFALNQNPDTLWLRIYNGFSSDLLYEHQYPILGSLPNILPTIVGYADFGNLISPGSGSLSIILRSPNGRIQFDTLPPNVINIIVILDPNTSQPSYCCSNCRLLAITDMDNDGYPDMIIVDTANGTLRVVGVDTDGFTWRR